MVKQKPPDEPPVQMLWPDPKTGPWSVLIHWCTIAGRPECIGLDVRYGTQLDGSSLAGAKPTPITATALRDLRPDALIRAARQRRIDGLGSSVDALHAYIRTENEASGRGRTAQSPFVAAKATRAKRSKPAAPATATLRSRAKRMGEPRRWPKGSKPRGRPKGKDTYAPEHWQMVADVYRAAWTAGVRGPTGEVAEHFQIGYSTAATWVSRCRSKGLLPPTTRGKPGAGPAKEQS